MAPVTRGLLPGLLACALTACPREAAPPAEAPTAAAPERPAAAPAAPSAIRFADITEQAGVSFEHTTGATGRRYILEPHSGGGAVLDADGDGRPDLYGVDGGPLPGWQGRARSNRLYRNRGDGTFEDVTVRAGAPGTGYGLGAFPADYDGDGDDDLLVTQFGPDALYRNRGDGTFEEVAAQAGVAGAGWSSSAVWWDADGDGDLDLFVARYISFTPETHRECWRQGVRYHCSPYDYPPAPDQLFLNRGDGTFEDGTARLGFSAPGKGLGVLAYDFDLDGRPELYVSNDETPNLLYRWTGGRYEEGGLPAGVAVNAAGAVQAGMGVDAGDLDGDGRPDLVVANFQGERNNDFRQIAPLLFLDRGNGSQFGTVSEAVLTFAVLLADLDLDGDLDSFVANGHVWDNVSEMEPSVAYPQRNFVLRNDGGRFSDVTAEAGPGLEPAAVSRSANLLDLEGDGDLDVFCLNLGARATLLRNDTPRAGRHFVAFRLRQGPPNRQALGARVDIEAGGRSQMRQLWRTRGFLGSSEALLHFGLGDAGRLTRVHVRWPDGHETDHPGLAVDVVHTLTRE